MFDEIPISTIKLPEGRFQTSNDISLSNMLLILKLDLTNKADGTT